VRLALKIIVGFIAALGVAYTALWVYATFFLPDCMLSYGAQATSQTGQYYAVYQQCPCSCTGGIFLGRLTKVSVFGIAW